MAHVISASFAVHPDSSMLATIILLLSIIFFRVAPWLGDGDLLRAVAGISPLMAFALCGGVFLPKRWALWFPLAAVVITHAVINSISGFPIIHPYAVVVAVSVAAVAVAGMALKKKASLAVLLGASVLSTVLFHLVSNTVSFFMEPEYAKNFAGWWQCQTTGLPLVTPPTWVFTLRQLAGDLIFTAMFYAAFRQSLPQSNIAPAANPAVATA